MSFIFTFLLLPTSFLPTLIFAFPLLSSFFLHLLSFTPQPVSSFLLSTWCTYLDALALPLPISVQFSSFPRLAFIASLSLSWFACPIPLSPLSLFHSYSKSIQTAHLFSYSHPLATFRLPLIKKLSSAFKYSFTLLDIQSLRTQNSFQMSISSHL